MLRGTALAVLTCALAASLQAQTYYLMSNMTNGDWGPPLPMNPCSSCTVYSQGNDRYWVDDRYNRQFSSSSMMAADGIDPSGGDTNGVSTNYDANGLISPMDLSYLTNGSLWIEAYSNDTQNVYLKLHNTTNTENYQVFGATNLALPFAVWLPGQIRPGDFGTNLTFFDPVPMVNAQTFFRGEQGNTVIFVDYTTVAHETNATLGIPGQPGIIQFSSQPGINNPLVVHYSLGGSAQNGVDYTNLSGETTIPGSGDNSVQIYVQPISPATLTNPVETVDFAVQPTTNYLVAPSQYTGTVLIKSSSTTVFVEPGGLDAVRPAAPGEPEQDGALYFSRFDDFGYYPPLTFYYQISGTASNGVDYQLLSGSLAFADGSNYTNMTIVPLAESPLRGTKTITATIVSSNGYVADTNYFTWTINVYDQTNKVGIDSAETAINSSGPPGDPAQIGAFNLSRFEPHGFYPEITAGYSMSGQAISGADYTAPTGSVTFPEGQLTASVPIQPINHWTNASKSVVMTLLPDSSYVIDTNRAMATGLIQNSSTRLPLYSSKMPLNPMARTRLNREFSLCSVMTAEVIIRRSQSITF